MISILTKFIFSIYHSIWRRLFGGWLAEIPYKDTNIQDYIIKKFHISVRLILEIIEILIVFVYLKYHMCYGYIPSIYSSLVITLLFWLPGHGVYFDIGRDYPPDENTIKRYNKQLSCKFLKLIFPKRNWYKKWFDFCGMTIRYTIPSILLIPVLHSIHFILLGLCIASIYAVCWNISYSNGKFKFNPTNLAEIISGFITGIFLSI